MKLIKSVSGIRGIYNKTLNLDEIAKYGYAFSKIQKNKTTPILVARDSRQSGLEIQKYLVNFLNNIGRDVICCDIIPTPTAQLIIDKFKIIGGIIITASHNPQEWNGMKFVDSNGTFLNKQKNIKMFDIAENINITDASEKKGKTTYYTESIDFHLNNIINISFINVKKIKKKQFKIVLDTINGASCLGFKKLLELLNCEIIAINNIPNGIFPRNPEPKTENLNQIPNIVIQESADLGLVTDPDGDRLAIIDNKGNIIIEENTLAICINEFLNKNNTNKTIVTNLSTTSALDDIADKHNIKVERTAVGEINVVEEMKKQNSLIGGEGNGGVILSESHYGRDAFVAAIIVLNHLATNNLTMYQANKLIPKYYMLKEKIKLNDQINDDSIYSKIKEKYKNYKFDERDGIKIIGRGFWIHIRKSNTEPIIRIYIESKKEEKLLSLFNDIKLILNR